MGSSVLRGVGLALEADLVAFLRSAEPQVLALMVILGALVLSLKSEFRRRRPGQPGE